MPARARWCDAVVVIAACGFVLWKLQPELLLTVTTTTGGDTASHYHAAWWLRHELLPQGRLGGWVPGNYAGYPLFQVYFPLPFLCIALLSLAIGLPVAFKLGTVAGLIALPLAAYACFRLLGFAFPAPALAALFSVPFLFHEADSMWGGNVASTLAGEFTYSWSVALLLLLAGTLYRGVARQRGWTGNAVLLAAVALCHAYTVLVAASLGLYLVLFHPEGRRALPYLLRVAALAFGLIAFWAVPLLAFAEYTTAYAIVWPIDGVAHVLPPMLWPLFALLCGGAVVAVLRRRRARARSAGAGAGDGGFDHRVGYLAALAVGSLFFYLIAWRLHVVDIRFLPFAQLTVALLAALPAAALLRRIVARDGAAVAPLATATLVAAALTLSAIHAGMGVVDQWAAWNYGGFESTAGWPAYRAVNEAVGRTFDDPRVVYEHSMAHDEAGTVRAFESLPLFSGAATLEGLYMQSSISSPFVFYIQSEISQIASCPLAPYHCARFDPARAAEHLRAFNADTVIARGDTVKRALDASPDFVAAAEVPPYRVFTLRGGAGGYVVPLTREPLVFTGSEWKSAFFNWFKRSGSGDVPLVRAGKAPLPSTWQQVVELPDTVPRRRLPSGTEVEVEMGAEAIRIRTSRPGHPLLVRISYHPRWTVQGAGSVWLASPSFMLLLPEQEEVTLAYRPALADRVGAAISMVSLLLLAASASVPARATGRWLASMPGPARTIGRWLDAGFRHRSLWAPPVVGALLVAAVFVRLGFTDPWEPHRRGVAAFHDGDYVLAEADLRHAVELAPDSTPAYYSRYYLALAAYRDERWDETLHRFGAFARAYPGSDMLGEARFRQAEALLELGRVDEGTAALVGVLEDFGDSRWATLAAQRLAALAARPGSGSRQDPEESPEVRRRGDTEQRGGARK